MLLHDKNRSWDNRTHSYRVSDIVSYQPTLTQSKGILGCWLLGLVKKLSPTKMGVDKLITNFAIFELFCESLCNTNFLKSLIRKVYVLRVILYIVSPNCQMFSETRKYICINCIRLLGVVLYIKYLFISEPKKV